MRYYVEVLCPEANALVQKLLFKKGYSWISEGIQFLNARGISWDRDIEHKYLGYSDRLSVYSERNNYTKLSIEEAILKLTDSTLSHFGSLKDGQKFSFIDEEFIKIRFVDSKGYAYALNLKTNLFITLYPKIQVKLIS